MLFVALDPNYSCITFKSAPKSKNHFLGVGAIRWAETSSPKNVFLTKIYNDILNTV